MLNSPVPGAALRTLGLFVAISLAVTSRAASGDELQTADQLLKAGQYRQALEQVDKVLAAKPSDPQARFLKGVILTEQGDTKDAVALFQKLTRDYPELPEPYNNLAVIYASQGEYEKARSALEQSIRTHPSYATAYENLGDVYATLAGRAYDKALQIDSSNSAAKHKLALLRDLVGGPPGSTQETRRVAAVTAPPVPATPPAPVARAGQARSLPAQPEAANASQASTKRPAAAKPAAAVAAVTKLQPEQSGEPVDRAILGTLEAWAKAWSQKDADTYLSFYAKDFDTPEGESRAAWARLRRERVTAPKWISVTLASPKVQIAPDGGASVTFRQIYRSSALRSTKTKTLVLERSGGRWLIRQERLER